MNGQEFWGLGKVRQTQPYQQQPHQSQHYQQ